MRTLYQIYINGAEFGKLMNETEVVKTQLANDTAWKDSEIRIEAVAVPDFWDKLKFGATIADIKLGQISKQIPGWVKLTLVGMVSIAAGWEAHKRYDDQDN